MRMKFTHALLAVVLAFAMPSFVVSIHAADAPDKQPAATFSAAAQDTTNATPAIPIKISVEAPAAAPAPAATPSIWETIFTSSAATTVYITLALYALKWASDKFKLDAERWEGLIIHCYNDAEQHGLLNSWAGHEKLAHAMQIFDDRFRSIFGSDPTARDREDARLDLARTAFNDDSNAAAPATATTAT